VEPPEGDPTRPLAALFEALNHGKECRSIDFRSSADLDRLRAWVQEADVLLDSFRPGVLQGLGLDAATLHALNPRLVMVSITGYGQHGPWAQKAGHDLNFMALSGVLDQLRAPTGELALSNVQWGDLAGGSAMACIAVLAAVFEAQKTGQGLRTGREHGPWPARPTGHALATGAMLAPLLGAAPARARTCSTACCPATTSTPHRMAATAVGALEFKF
jgi:crotonobetainyl-CoA:carnitine CoA-transferase CaiB-like acyl-CoA transferase